IHTESSVVDNCVGQGLVLDYFQPLESMNMEPVNQADLEALFEFLPCRTPDAWIQEALRQEEMLLLNHCYLEQCAARNALQLMFRCPDKPDVLIKMSKLAREELRHFEKVHALLVKRGYVYKSHKPSRYAGLMSEEIRKTNPGQLIDSLIVGAYIEARSCERFASLAPYMEDEIATFFRSLLKSEARHYKDYLTLAQTHSVDPIQERVALFGAIERKAIESEDDLFRFHSGVPPIELD
ncbi:MAG: tRNA-(ms[2]io[6]A)-hydroxylase, partial [Pontiella sp.]